MILLEETWVPYAVAEALPNDHTVYGSAHNGVGAGCVVAWPGPFAAPAASVACKTMYISK